MFDLFVRLIRVDLYVRFFVRFHVRFLPDIFVRHVLVRIFSEFLIRFHVRFLSDFLCPIFFVRFFCPNFLSDLFMSDFFCPILLSYFCPIYFIRRVYVRFFVLFFWPICCHIFCVISGQKRWNMSRHVMPPLSCTINMLVFLLLWQYRIHVWVWYSSSHQWLRTWPWDSKEQP